MKTIAEQIADLEATRAAKTARMAAVMQKSLDEGRSTDQAEAEEYDTLSTEVESIDGDLVRLKKLEKLNVAKATTVDQRPNAAAGSESRTPHVLSVKNSQKLAPGIKFARYVMCLGAAKGNLSSAFEIAQKRFPDDDDINLTLKAAVSAGTTTDATWALPLVEYNRFAGDFVEFLRPQTIIGKFGTNGIPSLRRVPFNIHIRGQTSGGSGYWVGQGKPKPLTKFGFEDIYLGFAKVANICVLTEELLRFSSPSAEMLVRDELAKALIERMDIDFIDPDKAAVANVSPASITNGTTPLNASGSDAADISTDVEAAMTTFLAANITPSNGVWIMSARTALRLSLMKNTLGQKVHPDLTMMGGKFEGLPVIVSEYITAATGGEFVVLVNASDIWLADDGNVVVDASREASLEMLDNPTNDSVTPTPTTMVSMFQTNSVALRAERWVNWKKRRAAAAVYIQGVTWGSSSS